MVDRVSPRKAIKYTNREFNSIKNDLLNYTKRYYPDTYKDFNEASFGSLMIDLVSYVGDMLSFYLDFQANENFLDTANEFDNIIQLGKQIGFKYSQNMTAYGRLAFYILIPADSFGTAPDTNYIPILTAGSRFASPSNMYTLIEDVDFSKTANETIVARVDSGTQAPTHYAVKAYGNAVSGELVTEIVTVRDFQKFLRISLGSSNVSEVLSVVDSEGHEYFEVEYLSQDVVYIAVTNYDTNTKEQAGSILKPLPVPRRFVVEQTRTNTFLQFGHGSDSEINSETINDPANVVLQRHAKNYFSNESFDPSDLLSSDKLGVSPSNTALRVVYRRNRATNVNAAINSVTTVSEPRFSFATDTVLDTSKTSDVAGSLEVTNEEPVVGNVTLMSAEEMKQRILNVHAAQNRAVTAQDYVALVYRMPTKFGAIKRCTIVQDTDSTKRNLKLYIISENAFGNFVESNTVLKNNLKIWLNDRKMINDTIDILDTRILNIGINFVVLSDQTAGKQSIFTSISDAINDYFRTPFDIGESVFLTDLYQVINRVPGVIDTIKVQITRKYGGTYSDMAFDIEENLSQDGRYLIVPNDTVIELKFSNIDIQGTIK